MSKGKLKGALVAMTAAAALTLVGPVGGALASTYQDFYSFGCGGGNIQMSSDTTGNTRHMRNGSLWAYWNGSSTRAVHYSNGTTYVTHGSVETSGTSAWVYSASIYCT